MTTASPIAPLLLTDGYKVGHVKQYPERTTRVYSNWTNRGSRLEGVDEVVHFGLQAFCQEFLIEAFAPFFAADEALHRKGYLPLRFCAVPEGTLVPLRVPSFTIENTEPEFFWLVNYIESALSAQIWHASTTATIALQYRRLLEEAALRTTGTTDGVAFQAHDFSFRGQTSIGAAEASGAGHLTSFLGTDSIPSIDWIRRYYPGENGLIAGSVPATEHSVMTAGGQAGERETFERLLSIYPSGILSVVSDTWDLWSVLETILPTLRERILARDGKLVIRPDSGNPVDILCGTVRELGQGATAPERGVIETLWDVFGGTVTAQGYKVLDPHIGAIYGDSITLERAAAIIERLEAKGFASTNVVFGIGSFTYQYVTRDTFASAIKATWAEVDGVGRDMLKDPVTDSGTKRSATGRLAVTRGKDGRLALIERATSAQEAASELQVVWEDGAAVRRQSFADVRARLHEERTARA
jgi:nicotinamide phosphoribosyltransferase